MLGSLVINEDLEVIKIALAVIAPGSRKDLLDIGMTSLFLAHVCVGRIGI